MRKIVSILSLSFISLAALSYEQQLVTDLARYGTVPEQEKNELFSQASLEPHRVKICSDKNAGIPLFKNYPVLKEHISYVHLGSLPTPVHHCKKLGEPFGKTQVYMKCDNATGGVFKGQKIFGGNKVRKLEFLLADAVANNARSVLTFGCAGSNHALATAAYAQQLGLKATLVLSDQPSSYVTRRNLLLDKYHDAHVLKAAKGSERVPVAARYCVQHKAEFCSIPYIIPVGGSCPRGILGFVNAAFELKEQIDAGLLPEPKYIVVACGSCGTTAGLMLGCKMAGLKTVVVPIAVEPDDYKDEMVQGIVSKFNQTAEFLAQYEPAFKEVTLKSEDVQLIRAFEGTEYGLFTPEATEAVRRVKDAEGVMLDGVYSGKAACALFSWLNESTEDTPILFWNTFCGDSFEELTQQVDYKDLPVEFQKYFTEDVQPLDRQQ